MIVHPMDDKVFIEYIELFRYQFDGKNILLDELERQGLFAVHDQADSGIYVTLGPHPFALKKAV